MSSFDYTESASTTSSFVVEVFFNKNDNSLVVNLEGDGTDKFYRYTNVPFYQYQALINSGSVGTYYNTVIKKEYGPATDLGNYIDVDENLVDFVSVPATPKDLTTATEPTKEFSLAGAPSAAKAAGETVEYSLAEKPVAVDHTQGEAVVSTVYFTLNGVDATYVSDKESVDDAIVELGEYVGRLGLSGRVNRVEVTVDFKYDN